MRTVRVYASELKQNDQFLTCITRRRGEAEQRREYGIRVIMEPITPGEVGCDEKWLHPKVLVDRIMDEQKIRSGT